MRRSQVPRRLGWGESPGQVVRGSLSNLTLPLKGKGERATAHSCFVAALLLASTLFPSLATAADWRENPWRSFEAELWATHHLSGLIWGVAEAREVKPEELAAALAQKRFVLLGEYHDNPDHHRLQAWLVAQLKPGAVVLEMVETDQAGALAAYQAVTDWSPAGLGKALDWEARGWPAWSIYQPIAEAAQESGATLFAGNVPRDKARAVAKQGVGSLDAAEAQRLGLHKPLPFEFEETLQGEIAASHCGMLPETVLPSMAMAQRLRDATMAEAMLAAAGPGKRAVLIAGNGHTRRERAVPYVLEDRGVAPDEIASLAFMEVDPEASAALDLVPMDGVDLPAADYIWITPGASRPDPCEEMEKQMKGGG